MPLLRSGVLIRQPESDRRVGPDASVLHKPGLDNFAVLLGVPHKLKKGTFPLVDHNGDKIEQHIGEPRKAVRILSPGLYEQRRP